MGSGDEEDIAAPKGKEIKLTAKFATAPRQFSLEIEEANMVLGIDPTEFDCVRLRENLNKTLDELIRAATTEDAVDLVRQKTVQ